MKSQLVKVLRKFLNAYYPRTLRKVKQQTEVGSYIQYTGIVFIVFYYRIFSKNNETNIASETGHRD